MHITRRISIERTIYFKKYEIGSVRGPIGRTITEVDIILHADRTRDFFPHHMDAEFAKTTEFGKRIIHGTLIFSIAVGMTANLINSAAFSYGYDHMCFTHPVFVGDIIHVKITLKGERENPRHPDRGFITEALEVFNQNGRLVMVCEHIMSCLKEITDA